ncbi:MAG: hypothetical protein MJK04_07695 [Psychrosphaera sp.]|nr:hypothetical protein [Psychrosphaera sp.]
MNVITANELKTKGIAAVEACLQVADEAIISVRGKDKYIVMAIAKYNAFREYELEVALQEAKADIKSGHVVTETAKQHIQSHTDLRK